MFSVELRRWLVKATACIMDCLVDLLVEEVNLLRLLLPGPVPSSFKLAQVVGVVHPAIIEIEFPVVITEDALLVWQNPHLVQRRTDSIGMRITITSPVE